MVTTLVDERGRKLHEEWMKERKFDSEGERTVQTSRTPYFYGKDERRGDRFTASSHLSSKSDRQLFSIVVM